MVWTCSGQGRTSLLRYHSRVNNLLAKMITWSFRSWTLLLIDPRNLSQIPSPSSPSCVLSPSLKRNTRSLCAAFFSSF
jgi:hypothetical protein